MATVSELLAVNGPLFGELDREITRIAHNYAANREGGASESMNIALEYATMRIAEMICKAAGEELQWAK